jgi:transcriptional regulator of acetoin/glycerol metabolism
MEEKIYLSWDRCIKNGLSKSISKPKIKLPSIEFQSLYQKHKQLISIFKDCIRKIKYSITGQYAFMLIDAQGILLEVDSSKQIQQQFKKYHIKPGMSFAEESCGTNAISMAMELQTAVYMKPEQHYCNFLKQWYCYATALHIGSEIIGYLDVSTVGQVMQKELMAITELLPYEIVYEFHRKTEGHRDSSDKEAVKLTSRQLEILQLMAEGHNEKEIAQALYISIRTVKFHKANMYKILGVERSEEAIVKALQKKLISVK